jgi:molecular chaperone HtpG
MATETLAFEAEVSKLLHIVTHSLYSEKEIFLRELISNASDACDRLRYQAISDPDLTIDDPEFRVRVIVDAKKRTLTVIDNGEGMNRDDLVANLGTIARSGSAAFSDQLTGDAEKDINLIGQFGVGFYSSFMVADTVEVVSRKAGEEEAWRWLSTGGGDFTIEPAEREGRGTTITLNMRKGEKEFLDGNRLTNIVKTYSDHIALPIIIETVGAEEGETSADPVNKASALWSRPKSEISDEQYTEFYRHVGNLYDEPWLTIHAKAEGRIEYSMLLFVPSTKPFDLFEPERKHRLKLYVKRVFITDECEGLVPSYLRFLRGVVDSQDLPLNISRELLQNNPVLGRIRKALVKRVLSELERKASKKPEEYFQFWENFGAVLKEGVYEDSEQRERLLKLARFQSVASDGPLSLADYIAKMPEGQDSIYYITGSDPEALARSPQLEGFIAKGIDVLLLSDPVDDFWLGVVNEFDEKPFKSVTQGGIDLSNMKADDTDEKPDEAEPEDSEVNLLIAAFKQTLEGTIKDVRKSERLTDSPVCLVADDHDLDLHMERLLRAHKQVETSAQRILEINAGHPLIRSLGARVKDKGIHRDVEEAAWLLLDQARIIEGEPLPDPAAFSKRMAEFMTKGLTV